MKKKIFLKRLKLYGICTCISYTLVSMILSVLNIGSELVTGNTWVANVQLFSVCLVISVLMLITDTIKDPETATTEATPGYILVGLLDVAIPVLGMGGFLYGWFDVFSTQVLYPICILVVVYIAVFAMFYIIGKKTERELNRIINDRKERSSHEKNNRSQ